jgi:large subunit ribosomal protein L24
MAKIKKGDKVKVIAGKDKGKEGLVMSVNFEKQKVNVEGVNLAKKHQKPTSEDNKGGIIEKDMPIHISNVMVVDSKGKPTRVGYEIKDSKKVRVSKKSGSEL